VVSGQVDRRLAAILAADVAGYSRLMSADEIGTFSALKAHRSDAIDPTIAAHKGRIVKTTGDGIQAVACALDIQKTMSERNRDIPGDQRIDFRIGINVGDIIIDGDDVFGDGVNIAARLEGLAEPGGIYLSRAVHEQVAGKVAAAFTELGARNLKNIDTPVHVFEVSPDGEGLQGSAAPQLLSERPSIAVLPFSGLSENRSLELLADGLAEDVIALLARVPGFFVIARSSSFA
jgi:class 3 adenylate cyclase